jgi:hypothetical protein
LGEGFLATGFLDAGLALGAGFFWVAALGFDFLEEAEGDTFAADFFCLDGFLDDAAMELF